MGFFNDGASAISSRTTRGRKYSYSHHSRRSRSSSSDHSVRSRGPAASVVGSLFGAAASGGNRSGFFSSLGGKSHGRPSYYKRTSRPNFLSRLLRLLRRLLRDILHWIRRHPLRVFILVILPLITSGALVALLARFGLRIPAKLDRWLRTGARAASGDTFGAMGEAMQLARGRRFNPEQPYGAYGKGGMGSGSAYGGGYGYENEYAGAYSGVQSVVRESSGGSHGGGFWNSAVKFFTE